MIMYRTCSKTGRNIRKISEQEPRYQVHLFLEKPVSASSTAVSQYNNINSDSRLSMR